MFSLPKNGILMKISQNLFKCYLSNITHDALEVATSCTTTFLTGVPAVILTSISTCTQKINDERNTETLKISHAALTKMCEIT